MQENINTNTSGKRSARMQDMESEDSFEGGTKMKRSTKVAWGGGSTVDENSFLKMQQEYRTMKIEHVDMEKKLKLMGAQLQRAEEAAKRALVMQHEVDQAGNLMPKAQTKRLLQANRVLGLEMEVSRLEASNRDLHAKLLRKQKEAADWKVKAAAAKARTAEVLKSGWQANKEIGKLKQQLTSKPTMSSMNAEEARRFAEVHDQLVDELNAVREENAILKQELEARNDDEPDEDELMTLKRERDEALDELDRIKHGKAPSAGPHMSNPLEEWILEEAVLENGSRCLRDAQEMVLFTDGTQERWPRPLGALSPEGRREKARLDAFLEGLDTMLLRSKGTLRGLFNKYATPDDGKHGEAGGKLDRKQVELMLRDLFGQEQPSGSAALTPADVDFVVLLLDVNGDGLISFPEFEASLKECVLARKDANNSQSLEMVALTSKLLGAVKLNMGALRQRFNEEALAGPLARADNPAIALHKAAALLSAPPFCSGLKDREKRLLLLMLLDWDLKSEGSIYFINLLRMVHAVRLVKVAPGQAVVRLLQA